MAHKHVDLNAAARAVFRDKLRRRRRATEDPRRALPSRHHSSERAVTERA
ncbi:MAG TPA: hypothetical protein VGF66_10150 [Gaiellaceae bacterium]|jgi:hypothetical protein